MKAKKKYYLSQFTEFIGEDENNRNYAHIVYIKDDKFLKCKTDRQFIKWFYYDKPIADDLTKDKDLWWLQDKYVRYDDTRKISKATYKLLKELGVA